MFRLTVLTAVIALASLQPGMKTLTILDAWNEEKTSPVKIVGVSLNDQQIVSDTPFQASDDWIRDLKFTVQNVSTKSIKQIVLRLVVPIDGKNYAYRIAAGKNYFDVPVPLDSNDELLFTPGQSKTIEFNTTNPENYQGLVLGFQRENINLSDLNKAEVYLIAAIFEDTKTAWYKGKYMQRTSPTEWRVVKE
jgi:hypothetical protein